MHKFLKRYVHKVIFILPALLLFSLFVIYPFVDSIHYSLTQWDGVSKPIFIGFENFTRLFKDESFIAAIKNTLIFATATFVIGNPLSILLALALSRKIPGRGILRTIFYLPCVLSLMVISIIWGSILSYNGLINEVLKVIGMGGFVTDWISGFHTVIPALLLIMIWQSTGYGAIIYLAGIQSISKEIYESADIDGTTGWSKFWYITLPLLMPSVTIVTFLGLTGSLKIFDLPYIMTNGGPGTASVTIAMKVYTQAFLDRNYGYATASGLILFIFVMVVSILQINFTRSKEVQM